MTHLVKNSCPDIEILHDFVDDKLLVEEKKELTQHLDSCQECKDSVEGIEILKKLHPEIKDTKKYIREKSEQEYKKIKDKIPEHFFSPDFSTSKKSNVKNIFTKSTLGIAATIVLLLCSIFLTNYYSKNTTNKYFETNDIAYLEALKNTTRGGNSEIKQGKIKFKNKLYQEASQIFEKEFEKNANFDTGFYLAMSYFGNQEYDKAITYFETLLKLEDIKNSKRQTDLITFELFKLHLQKEDTERVKKLLPRLGKSMFDKRVEKLVVPEM